MCAFIPATANWSGRTRWSSRRSNTAVQACGVAGGSSTWSRVAAKYKLAKMTSRRSIKAWSWKKPVRTRCWNAFVTSRYMRLK